MFDDDLCDDELDAILDGRDTGRPDVAPLAAFVAEVRELGSGPVPEPSLALASLLKHGVPVDESGSLRPAAVGNLPGREAKAAASRRTRRSTAARFVAGLGVGAKVALGVGVAAAGVGVAGAAGALPGPVQHAAAVTVSAVTPFEFPDEADSHADHGKTTSSDATGASDDQNGVNGQSVSSSAADSGSSTASETPAGDHGPVSVPVGPPADPGSQRSNSSNSDNSNSSNSNSSSGEHGPPADPGSQSSNGLDTSSGTPGGAHVPPSVPSGHP